MFNYKYLTSDHLKGFDNYKYRAIDTSPLTNYVMHPIWNTAVKLLPKWIAPNLLTLLGFLCLLAAAATTSWYDYDWYASGGRPGHQYNGQYEIPNYIYIISSVLIFLAYNLDGIDGKQARRIGVSGPLGEMFDHGLDSMSMFLIPFCAISIFGRDEFFVPMFRGYLAIGSIVLNFYLTQWEKYNTGVFYLPWGCDVGMWVAIVLLFIAGVNGPGCYKMHLINNVTFGQVMEVIIYAAGLLTTLPVSIYNIYMSNKNNKGKNHGFIEAVRPLRSISSMIIVMTYWALKSPNNIIETYPRVFFLLFGIISSNIASRLLVAEMTNHRCELINGLVWPLLGGLALTLYRPHLEGLILRALLLVSVFAHVHYGICLVRQMCDHFKVKCFVVPKVKRKFK